MTLVQLLRGYNQKHIMISNENLIHIQHYYNREVHACIGKFPFETCFGYFPPMPIDVVYGQQGGEKEDTASKVLRDKKIINKMRWIHLQV